MKKVLNVGGYNRDIPLPTPYNGWQQVMLDVDPATKPDICCDARDLMLQSPAMFDAVYCSHNLEHYHRHEVSRVLAGFRHVLKPDGFVHITVPDIAAVMRRAVEANLDINDVLYTVPAGAITVHDVIYGWGVEIEQRNNPFFAHKTGFTGKSLVEALQLARFDWVYAGSKNFDLTAVAFTAEPTAEHASLLGLPAKP